MTVVDAADHVEEFIRRWTASSGAERANFQLFASQLCRILGVSEPDPAQEDGSLNDYTFERTVEFKQADGSKSLGRIDLYKRSCFVMEAKQSREKGRRKELQFAGHPDLFVPDYAPRGKRGANRAWDQFMINARHQAQGYARALEPNHGWPPFILVCDVGHCIEVYADFSGQGKNYAQFPDRQGFRIFLDELRSSAMRDRLSLIWENPSALDPARQSAKVTREIANRLAAVSKGLEARGFAPEEVALFLMRCLFTMFAEDVGLLPEESFKNVLARCSTDGAKFVPLVEQLWLAMDKGEFAYAIERRVKRFNGKLFKNATAVSLPKEEIGELAAAAAYDWREVEPAIFGTLLEQALDKNERARLGAHYTPRAHVERLVVVTVIEPLRQEWAQVQATAERLKEEKRNQDAIAVVRRFHEKLCTTRVLDPACGTGNFLYVAMELMKRLEGEVVEALLDLGGQETLALDRQTVDPHQFLGLEVNPRAAAIAELVIWIGYLQWHYRTKGGAPAEPILRDFGNITVKDAVLTWDGWPAVADGVAEYPNARRPEWPEAEYIVGNPPFIGGKDIRAILGARYAETLWRVHSHVNKSADFVMYWWDRAAAIVASNGVTKRFGLVTTNSITQEFSRRIVARHLGAEKPVSLLMAIPDHPWTKATEKAAAVRIAMTVVTPGHYSGVLREVTSEAKLDTDQPEIELSATVGRINADLTIGADVTTASPLRSNDSICSPGVKLHGSGFIVTLREAEMLGVGRRPGLEKHIRPYRNGRDLAARPRGAMVIDLFGLDVNDVRRRFPEVYQHLSETVKIERDLNRRATYRDNWWIFGEPRRELRPALNGLSRYIATVETAKHRIFQFLDGTILPDNMIVVIASDDAFHLGILSSRVHATWSAFCGATLEDRPRYTKSLCFDPFPFPQCPEATKVRIRGISAELDAHRKARQVEHPDLTLTQMYNVLEMLKTGIELDEESERIKRDGTVVILKELHEKLDILVFAAYGWPPSLTDTEILRALVDLNKRQALGEAVGQVNWLRPDYQIPRFVSNAEEACTTDPAQSGASNEHEIESIDDRRQMKSSFPTGNELAETAAVMDVLSRVQKPLSIADICGRFSQGRQVEKRVRITTIALARLGYITSHDGGLAWSLQQRGSMNAVV